MGLRPLPILLRDACGVCHHEWRLLLAIGVPFYAVWPFLFSEHGPFFYRGQTPGYLMYINLGLVFLPQVLILNALTWRRPPRRQAFAPKLLSFAVNCVCFALLAALSIAPPAIWLFLIAKPLGDALRGHVPHWVMVAWVWGSMACMGIASCWISAINGVLKPWLVSPQPKRTRQLVQLLVAARPYWLTGLFGSILWNALFFGMIILSNKPHTLLSDLFSAILGVSIMCFMSAMEITAYRYIRCRLH